MSDYHEFLRQKAIVYHGSGIDVSPDAIHPFLKPFQRDLTIWALRKGRAAIFADTGLGKTYTEAEWAKHVHQHTGLIRALRNQGEPYYTQEVTPGD